MSRRTRVVTLEVRLHRLMERTGAKEFRITSGRSHYRSGRHFHLELDLSRGTEAPPEWKRFGYVQKEAWKWEGFEGALELLVADAEQEFEEQIARVAIERATEAASRRAENEGEA